MMNLLVRFLREPAIVRDWDMAAWNAFVPLARSARLLGRCAYLVEQHGLHAVVPPALLDQMRGALAQTRYVQVQAQRELRHVARLMAREHIPLAALKGVAYLVARLPPCQWRNLSDIDVLVPQQDIARAERALLNAGWQPSGDFDDYDRHYYREWMHEVPPMRHPARETEVDLHHNLAPPVSRVSIDAARLWEAMVEVEAAPGLKLSVLGPADMLLHNAVHLFMNDELRGGLRDVVDFRDLYEHFLGADAGFEQALLARADRLDCGLPLYYAVSTATRLCGLQPGAAVIEALARFAPAAPVDRLMRWLIEQALAPDRLGLRVTGLAHQALYIRSHWVRMPLPMLLRHLVRKWLKRRQPQASIADTPG